MRLVFSRSHQKKVPSSICGIAHCDAGKGQRSGLDASLWRRRRRVALWRLGSNGASLHRAGSSSILRRVVVVSAGVGALAVAGPAGGRGWEAGLGLPASFQDVAVESVTDRLLVVFVALDCSVGADRQVALVVRHSDDNNDGKLKSRCQRTSGSKRADMLKSRSDK